MENYIYFLAPFFAYLTAGAIKFLFNTLKNKQWAFQQIGLGGLPSTHNTVTSTVATLVILKEGMNSPMVAIALGLALIVAVDSMGLRKHIETHAKILAKSNKDTPIRTRLGHTPFEVLCGIILGILCGFVLYAFTS